MAGHKMAAGPEVADGQQDKASPHLCVAPGGCFPYVPLLAIVSLSVLHRSV